MVPSWLKIVLNEQLSAQSIVFNVNCKCMQNYVHFDKIIKYESVPLKMLFHKISSFHPPSTCPFLLVLSLILGFILFMLNGKITSNF